MNLAALKPGQKHQVGVYLTAAEAVIQGLKVKVVKGWGDAHSLEIDGKPVRVFVRASASYDPATFVFEYRRAISGTKVTAAILVDVLTEPPVFYVVPRDMLGNGGTFKLDAWLGRWDLLQPQQDARSL